MLGQFGDIEVTMSSPGANSDMKGAALVKMGSISGENFHVDPTLMAEEMRAGRAMASVRPSLPLAITVAMPTERRLSIAGFRTSVSQLLVKRPLPRLMLTAAKLNWPRTA